MTHSRVSVVYMQSCVFCIQMHGTGWRRPVGCLKLQVILRIRATNDRALLRKMIYEDKASYDSTPPCTHSRVCVVYIVCVWYMCNPGSCVFKFILPRVMCVLYVYNHASFVFKMGMGWLRLVAAIKL